MLGIYVAYGLVDKLGGGAWFWLALLLAALIVGGPRRAGGDAAAAAHLPRARAVPTAGHVRAGADDQGLRAVDVGALKTCSGRARRGWRMRSDILGRRFPSYDLLLIAIGPLVLLALWGLLTRTRFGTLVRAATQDREMVAALGVNQAWLFTAVFALGAMLAGLGGAFAAAARAGQPGAGPGGDRRGFRRRGRRRHGLDPRRLRSRIADRRDQGRCVSAWAPSNCSAWPSRCPSSRWVVEFLVMAIVLGGAPVGSVRPCPSAQPPHRRARGALEACRPPHALGRRCADGRIDGTAVAHGAVALRHRAGHRPAHRRALRRQPALHHGPGRHCIHSATAAYFGLGLPTAPHYWC